MSSQARERRQALALLKSPDGRAAAAEQLVGSLMAAAAKGIEDVDGVGDQVLDAVRKALKGITPDRLSGLEEPLILYGGAARPPSTFRCCSLLAGEQRRSRCGRPGSTRNAAGRHTQRPRAH